MTIDELMQENQETLIRMKQENWDAMRFILELKNDAVRLMAHKYWNLGIMPPAEYYYNVGEYIKCHSEEFKGAGPQ